MFRIALAVLAGAAAFAAPASERDLSNDAKVAKRLAGLIPGEPQSCINPSRSQGGEHLGNIVLMKDQSGVLYRANLQGGCMVRSTDSIISRRPSTRLCSGDIIEIRDIGMGAFRGACTYSEFVPYRKTR